MQKFIKYTREKNETNKALLTVVSSYYFITGLCLMLTTSILLVVNQNFAFEYGKTFYVSFFGYLLTALFLDILCTRKANLKENEYMFKIRFINALIMIVSGLNLIILT